MMNGYCLPSQDIRDLIERGILIVPEKNLGLTGDKFSTEHFAHTFSDENLEGRIQPGSFDCSLGDEMFRLDTDAVGLFRPSRTETVYRTLLEIPSRHRTRISLNESGAELRTGFTYLVRLNERIAHDSDATLDVVKSSPKSSTGRVFPKTRLLVDYNDSFDEFVPIDGRELEMWFLIQPLPFNLVARPGIALNQIRFFKGDAKLSAGELAEEYKKNPLAFLKGSDKSFPVSEISLRDGLQINLDLEAKSTFGVCGLKARRNPDSIDLSQKSGAPSEKYFEPIMARDGTVVVRKGEHYLFASQHVLKIPSHLSAELRRHFHGGIEGRTHDAGFVDAGFEGDLVFELSPDEETKVTIQHGAPLSRLNFDRMRVVPDKIYGTGSNYQRQQGPRHSKHLKLFDFASGAAKHKKLDRKVLVQEARLLTGFPLRIVGDGFEPINPNQINYLNSLINAGGFFMSRYDCEEDPLVLQPIPYIAIFDRDGRIFSYVRANNIEDYGDKRLFGKFSLGVGGHIDPSDGPNFTLNCLKRELREEIIIRGKYSKPTLVGTLMAHATPVDEVHFGLIYGTIVDGNVDVKDFGLKRGEMIGLGKILADPDSVKKYETWSKILLPHLEQIYQISLAVA